MFGLSLAELLVICLVALIFIKPQDLPEIAHFLGRMFFRCKKIFNDFKQQFKEVEKDLGFDEIKEEINRGIIAEKIKLSESEATVIVDMHGNEHVIHNIHELRPDLDKNSINEEVKKLNEENSVKNPVV